MIDDDISKKLHQLQAKEISKTNQAMSFSRVINKELRKQLK
jgi:hypothetical protein